MSHQDSSKPGSSVSQKIWDLTKLTEGGFELVMNFARILMLLGAIGGCSSPALAAQNPQNQKTISIDPKKGDDENAPFAAVEEELKAKRAIKFAEKEYQENLDRARDLSVLGAELVASFKQKHTLDQEDINKLDKVEKLTKRIRNAAGGSEDDTEIEKPPTDMAAAVKMLGELSHSLKEKVEKTPKHVISAAVIDQANALLELIRIVRTLPSKV